MNHCLHCQAPLPEGWSFCGPTCTQAEVATSPPGDSPAPPSIEGLLTSAELSAKTGLSHATLHNYIQARTLSCVKSGGRLYFNLKTALEELEAGGSTITKNKVRAALIRTTDIKPTDIKPTDVVFSEPPLPAGLPAIRQEMCEAAKQAARDVILERADQAKARGDHELRAQLLDDFIYLEEGLKLAFSERRA